MEIRPILSAMRRNRSGPLLVALQVALSLAILANALHIVVQRQALSARPTGLAAEEQVFALQVRHLRPASHVRQLALQRAETAVLGAVPGVLAVAKVSQMPLSRIGIASSITITAAAGQSGTRHFAAVYRSPDALLSTWGLRLSAGRDLAPADVREADQNTSTRLPEVALITAALAQRLWPDGASPLGRTIYFDGGSAARVAGVIERLQSHNARAGSDGELAVIVPLRQTGESEVLYTLRAAPGQLDRVMQAAQAALQAAAPEPLVLRPRSMGELRAERYRAERGLAWMLVAVCVLLLLTTAGGIVGMASLWVTQRRQQIGVRRALGARRRDIVRYFITENVLITTAGIGAGVPLALGLNQLLVSQLDMARLPPAYLLAGGAVFWLLGAVAACGPAWRAASISPALATRGH